MRSGLFTLLSVLVISCFITADTFARPKENYFRDYRIVVYGDSFTAGYGLEKRDAYPLELRKLLNEKFERDRIEVINAGVEGDTAATGASRVGSILEQKPDVVIVAFGMTDVYHEIEPNIIRKGLEQILQTLTYNNIYVVIAGVYAPPHVDTAYAARFNSIYPEIAKRYQVGYVYNMLKHVRDDQMMLQFDGIHPNEEGMDQIAKNMYPALEKMVKYMRARDF